MSDSLWPYGFKPTRLLSPWDSPGKNTGVGSHSLLQRIFTTQGSNPCLLCLLHWYVGSLRLKHLPGSPWRGIVGSRAARGQPYTYRWMLVTALGQRMFMDSESIGYVWYHCRKSLGDHLCVSSRLTTHLRPRTGSDLPVSCSKFVVKSRFLLPKHKWWDPTPRGKRGSCLE